MTPEPAAETASPHAAALPPDGFDGRWFDGRRAAGHAVRFAFGGGELLLSNAATGALLARHQLAETRVAEPLRNAPRTFHLPGGGLLQADDGPTLAHALRAAGVATSPVVAMQRAWPASLLALLVLLAASWWLYVDGLPALSDRAAGALSPALEERMGAQALAALDGTLLQPSRLDADRHAEIAQRFAAFSRAAAIGARTRLEFRSIEGDDGVNAFALPGGTIVLLDGMVAHVGKDDEMLLAVLAHEVGHQESRHMTRSLFRALGGVALAGLLWGDYSSVASNAAVLFGQLSYSRDDELAADDFAIAALGRAGVSPGALARFFWDVESKERGAKAPSWASTHPDAGERAERATKAADAYEERSGVVIPQR